MAKKNPPVHQPAKTPARRSPLFQGDEPLAFDIAEDLTQLTPEQEQAKFMSRWLEVFDPYDEWPRVFRRGVVAGDRILHDVKVQYKRLVLEGDWSEKKYVMVINSIFEARGNLSPYSLDRMGLMYDEERLPLQVRLRRGSN